MPIKKKQKSVKCKHDFSYKGKKTSSQINCKKCGVNMVEWVREQIKDYENYNW